MMRSWLQSGMGALALMLALTGCGGPGVAPAAPRTGALAALGDDDFGQQDLRQAPVEGIDVPGRPTRAPAPTTDGNAAKLYVSAPETVPAIKALVAGAQHSVYIEMYNFIDDPDLAGPVSELLASRARAGVSVKLIIDFVGSCTRPGYRQLVRRMRSAGVEVRIYKPRRIRKDDKMIGINITHRKLYLADGVRALVGGVNLKHDFATTTQDVLVDWRGPIVPQLYDEFASEWRGVGGKPLPPVSFEGPLPGAVRASVRVTSPREGRFEFRDTLYAAVEHAQSEIRIENQYLWDDRLVARLHDALSRGVTVRVIVPGEEDKGVFKYIHSEEIQRLVNHGAQARLFTGLVAPGHLHVKYFGVDDPWVAIGSANGDTRGLTDNQELDSVSEDAALASEFRARLFETDWASHSTPFVYKPSSLVTRPFRSLLELIDYFM